MAHDGAGEAVRRKFASFTWRQWQPVLALALIFATMNLSLYVAIDRIGLGLAVTLEFLGPLAVALLASRRVVDLGCSLVAGAPVVVLGRPQPRTDYAGIVLALPAAGRRGGDRRHRARERGSRQHRRAGPRGPGRSSTGATRVSDVLGAGGTLTTAKGCSRSYLCGDGGGDEHRGPSPPDRIR